MPLKLYQETTADQSVSFRNFVDWLCGTTRGDLSTSGPVGITVVEADDGAIRETGGGDLSSLGAGNLWRLGTTLPVDSWIVLDFPGTAESSGFQVYWHQNKAVGGANRWGYQLIPESDWATGGGQGSTPAQPATTIPTIITAGKNQPSANWAGETVRAWCDEGVLCMAADDGSTHCHMYYVGEIDDSAAADTEPLAIYTTVSGLINSQTDWARLSPLDGDTHLGYDGDGDSRTLLVGDMFQVNSWSTSNEFADFGDKPRTKIGPGWEEVGHRHWSGFCRYLELINGDAGNRSTSDSLARINFGDFPGGGQNLGCYSLPWDGVTAFS